MAHVIVKATPMTSSAGVISALACRTCQGTGGFDVLGFCPVCHGLGVDVGLEQTYLTWRRQMGLC